MIVKILKSIPDLVVFEHDDIDFVKFKGANGIQIVKATDCHMVKPIRFTD